MKTKVKKEGSLFTQSEVKEVKKINILSLAKILALFGVLYGVFYGIMFGFSASQLGVSFSDAASYAKEYATQDPQAAGQIFLLGFGWWNILLMPIFMGIVQFVAGVIIAWVYNLIAKRIGGVRVLLN